MTVPLPVGSTGGRPPGRRPLGPGLVAFIVVDVVLVLAVVVFAVVTFTGGPRDADDATPTQAVSGTATPTAASPTAESPTGEAPSDRPDGTDQRFATPSGNIMCEITVEGARCGIASLATKPAPVEGCAGSVGYVYVVDGSGAVDVPCTAKSDLPKKAGDGTDVLGYGSTARAYGFTCSSEETGMTCVDDASGRGFSLARAGGRTV